MDETKDAVLAGLMETWPAFQREVDTQHLNTDTVREGWPKPTIYREHEAIHVLCNVIDNLRREKAEAWDEGWEVGHDTDAYYASDANYQTNPYRQETLEENMARAVRRRPL